MIAVIAPGHDEGDRRVNRVVEAFVRQGRDVRLYLEATRVTNASGLDAIIYDPPSLYTLVKSFLIGRIDDVFPGLENSDGVYIHDSGLYGLILVIALRAQLKEKSLIFDYHDFIEWETVHHLSKVFRLLSLSYVLQKIFLAGLAFFVRRNVSFSAVVGISEGQLESFQRFVTCPSNTRYLVVPNSRKKIRLDQLTHSSGQQLALLWVGNVGSNRNLSEFVRLSTKLQTLPRDKCPVPLVVGKVWGSASPESLELTFLGAFETDTDVVKHTLNYRPIGVFFGWADPKGIGINEISSPNKVYTYINIEIPFLIPCNLDSLIAKENIPGIFIFYDDDDFVRKYKWICANYEYCVGEVRALKDNVQWDEELIKKIQSLYAENAS